MPGHCYGYCSYLIFNAMGVAGPSSLSDCAPARAARQHINKVIKVIKGASWVLKGQSFGSLVSSDSRWPKILGQRGYNKILSHLKSDRDKLALKEHIMICHVKEFQQSESPWQIVAFLPFELCFALL